jgi:nucleotide-binding universal stress UspA family protein
MPAQKLLVPVDGSPESLRALEYATSSAQSTGSAVHLLNVQPQIMAGDITIFRTAKMVADSRMAAAMEALRPAKALLERRGIAYTSEIRWGSAAHEIARCAAASACTKVVMGTRGRGFLARLFSSSVAGEVVQRATVPVTLIKENGAARRALAVCMKCIFGRWTGTDASCLCST